MPVSIHAPRVGRDSRVSLVEPEHPVSIHAPRVGRDGGGEGGLVGAPVSIHAPRVGRDRFDVWSGLLQHVSIHAPRVGRDRITVSYCCHVRQMTVSANLDAKGNDAHVKEQGRRHQMAVTCLFIGLFVIAANLPGFSWSLHVRGSLLYDQRAI